MVESKNTWRVHGFGRGNQAEQVSVPVTTRAEAKRIVSDYKKLEGIQHIELRFNDSQVDDYDFTSRGKWEITDIAQPVRVSNKTVFSLREIFHAWAHQTQESGRTANKAEGRGNWYGRSRGGVSVYFQGPVIYSYGKHYELAQIIPSTRQESGSYVLFNSEKHSVTTSQHTSDARRATHQHESVDVPYVDTLPNDAAWNTQNEMNVAWFERNLKLAHTAYLQAHKGLKYKRVLAYARILDTYERYCKLTDCTQEAACPLNSEDIQDAYATHLDAHHAYEAKRNEASSKAATTRYAMQHISRSLGRRGDGQAECARIRALPKKQREAEIDSVTRNLESIRAEKEAERAIERAKEWAENAVKHAQAMIDWRAGGLVSSWVLNTLPTMLRIETKEFSASDATRNVSEELRSEIATSQGARFPLSHGKLAWKLLSALVVDSDGDASSIIWKRNGHSIHLGHYQVDTLMGNGTIHAGCHVIAWSEVESIAKQLGLIAS